MPRARRAWPPRRRFAWAFRGSASLERMTTDARAERARERKLGVAYGFATYGFWGLFPLYLKAVSRTPVLELLCHRIVWAALLLLAIVWHQGHAGEVLSALRQRRT